MEKLPSDMKMELAKKLKGKDILNLCKTSKEMNKIYSSDRYNLLWQNKLKEEFNIGYRGKDSYNRYVREAELYQRDFYQLIVNFDDNKEYYLFTSREEAVEYAIDILLEDEENYTNYHELREHFTGENSFEIENSHLSCEIDAIRLTQNVNHYRRNKYEERKEKTREKFGENYESFLSLIYHVEDQLYQHKYKNINEALDDLMGEILPDKYLFDESSFNEDSPFDNDIFRNTKNFLKPFFPEFE